MPLRPRGLRLSSTVVVVVWSQQYMQVQDQPAQMWNQAQAALQKISPMQMSIKQPQQQAFYMAAQEPLKLYEHQLQPPSQPQLANMDKKIKYPNLKMQDFFWEPSYRMGESLAVMTDRMKRVCPEQDPSTGPRGPPFEVSSFRVRGGSGGGPVLLLVSVFSLL